MAKRSHRPSVPTPGNWVEQGTPMDALRAMLSRPVVMTGEFHAVYSRLLNGDMQRDPRIRYLLEELLHTGGEMFDDSRKLMMEGRIPTCAPGDEDLTFRERMEEVSGYGEH